MHLEAVLEKPDVERLLREFTPIRIHMTPTDEDTRWVELDEPDLIELVPGKGVRIECAGRIRYTVAGARVPLSIRKLRVLLAPRVVQKPGAKARLAFFVELEGGDLRHVPDLLDGRLVGLVNDKLTPRATNMVWPFGQTMTRQVPMPERLEPLGELGLTVEDARVDVDEHSLRFRVELGASLGRTKPRPTDDG